VFGIAEPACLQRLTATVHRWSADGHRVLAFAFGVVNPHTAVTSSDAVERDLTFVGVAALFDPPRPEVPAAIATCHKAGVRVVMLTGDGPETAQSIARPDRADGEAGRASLLGDDLEWMGEEYLRRALAAASLHNVRGTLGELNN